MDIIFVKLLILFLLKCVYSPVPVPPLQNNNYAYQGNCNNANRVYYPPIQEESVYNQPSSKPFVQYYATHEPVHQSNNAHFTYTNQSEQTVLINSNTELDCWSKVFPKEVSSKIRCDKKTETTILKLLQKLCIDIFLNKRPDTVNLREIFHTIAHLESISAPIIFGLLTILRVSSYNNFLMYYRTEWGMLWQRLCLSWTKDCFDYHNEKLLPLSFILLREEINYTESIEKAIKNSRKEFPLKTLIYAREVKEGESIPRRPAFNRRVNFMLIKNRYPLYERFFDEEWSPLLLSYTFNFLVIDNWKNYWVVATPLNSHNSVLLAIGSDHAAPYQVSDGDKVWQTSMIGDMNNFQIILEDNLINKRQELYYQEINLDSFFGKVSNLFTSFFVLYSAFTATFSFVFSSLFIANCTGYCDKCDNNTVTFFGLFFISSFGGILGYMMINIISFNEDKHSNSSVIKYKHYISKNLMHGNTITKYIYLSRENAKNVSMNKFVFISLLFPSLILLIWPLICINSLLTNRDNLIYFFSKLSYFVGSGLIMSLCGYKKMINEENYRIKEDSRTERISGV